MDQPDVDVVIVGARVAGASLAARLGERGVRVLVVDRATMPSQPTVPSCPVIYPHTMHLLDELGMDEADYADPLGLSRTVEIQFGTYFTSTIRLPRLHGRDYLYAIDRSRFDHLLWKRLARFPTVTAREGFGVTELLRDDAGRVIGIRGRAQDGPEETIRARCVVGADGRYSLVARKAGAAVLEDAGEQTSTAYYADWEGCAPHASGEPQVFRIYATGRGLDILFMPAPGGRYTICTHERSDRVHVGGDAEGYYLRTLRAHPTVMRWLGSAERVSPIAGMKKIQNRYIEPGGPGWVLVGDAFHHKDPADGQGIYDALIESKVLDEALASYLAGEQSWDEALARYRRRALEETHAMFLTTAERVRRELYQEPPALVIRTVLRWVLTDPVYQDTFARYICRAIPPEQWMDPALMRGAVLRGIGRDVRQLFGRERRQG